MECVPHRIMFLLMSDAGLRLNEVVQLNQMDLMLEGVAVRYLHVRAEIAKNKQPRSIPLAASMSKLIETLPAAYWPPHKRGNQFPAFFSPRSTDRIQPRQVQRILLNYSLRSLGLKVNPHMLRHTFATRLMRTTSIPIVQMLLGHSSLASTSIYTHPSLTDLELAVASISHAPQSEESQAP